MSEKRTSTNLYSGRLKGWTKLKAEELWKVFSSVFPSEEEAVAAAIFAANRLIKKSNSKSTRKIFYSIKDLFLEKIAAKQGTFTFGNKVRDEYTICRKCGGKGRGLFYCDECKGTGCSRYKYREEEDIECDLFIAKELCNRNCPDFSSCPSCHGKGYVEGKCPDCNGAGQYYTGTLFLWRFNINGQPYSFHSYRKPPKIEEELGEDKETFGGQFTKEELQVLKLPQSGLVKMLRYYASVNWGWSWYSY